MERNPWEGQNIQWLKLFSLKKTGLVLVQQRKLQHLLKSKGRVDKNTFVFRNSIPAHGQSRLQTHPEAGYFKSHLHKLQLLQFRSHYIVRQMPAACHSCNIRCSAITESYLQSHKFRSPIFTVFKIHFNIVLTSGLGPQISAYLSQFPSKYCTDFWYLTN
jgi:hypothetical protein